MYDFVAWVRNHQQRWMEADRKAEILFPQEGLLQAYLLEAVKGYFYPTSQQLFSFFLKFSFFLLLRHKTSAKHLPSV